MFDPASRRRSLQLVVGGSVLMVALVLIGVLSAQNRSPKVRRLRSLGG